MDHGTNITTSKTGMVGDRTFQSGSELQGAANMGSFDYKSLLLKICAANHWNPPVFECCKEEGPVHRRLFTYKVNVGIEKPAVTVLECFSDPHLKKKAAAQHAAEGAVWGLRNLGYSETTIGKKG